jgi:hypothetical protein
MGYDLRDEQNVLKWPCRLKVRQARLVAQDHQVRLNEILRGRQVDLTRPVSGRSRSFSKRWIVVAPWSSSDPPTG